MLETAEFCINKGQKMLSVTAESFTGRKKEKKIIPPSFKMFAFN